MNQKLMKTMGMLTGALVLVAAIVALVKVAGVGVPLSYVGVVGLTWGLPLAVILFGLFFGIAALTRRAAQRDQQGQGEP